jgi:hypothetical protein
VVVIWFQPLYWMVQALTALRKKQTVDVDDICVVCREKPWLYLTFPCACKIFFCVGCGESITTCPTCQRVASPQEWQVFLSSK